MSRLRVAICAGLAAVLTATLAGGPAGARPRQVEVVLSGTTFSPKFLTIRPGDTVRWVHRDAGEPHTVTSQPGQRVRFDSSPNAGSSRCALLLDDCMYEGGHDSFEATFDRPGSYTVAYYCKIHGKPTGSPARGGCAMCGLITVVEPRARASASPVPSESAVPSEPPTPAPTPAPTEPEPDLPSPSPTETVEGAPVAAGDQPPGGDDRSAVAAVLVTVLLGLGWLVWRRMIAA